MDTIFVPNTKVFAPVILLSAPIATLFSPVTIVSLPKAILAFPVANALVPYAIASDPLFLRSFSVKFFCKFSSSSLSFLSLFAFSSSSLATLSYSLERIKSSSDGFNPS